MLTSLSTRTGAPKSAAKRSGIGKPSQPGMIGGLRGSPVECSTGPGTPIPMPATAPRSDPASASSGAKRCSTHSSTASGPVGDLDVAAVLGQHRAAEVGDREPRVGGAEVGREDQRRRPR